MRGTDIVWCESAQVLDPADMEWLTPKKKTMTRMALHSSGKGSGSRGACAMDREQGATCKCFDGGGLSGYESPYCSKSSGPG
ncbi:hypothetical protein LI328DRAFT_133213 [Trichoderma asperelloides]|nr:hypothetical protein LI328DRAFT_133213 [Trichoderma asperelloides]